MKILVAGMHSPDNKFVRYVLDCGFEAIHLQSLGTKDIPLCDGVILALCQINHGMSKQIFDLYKSNNLPIFQSHNGISEIKVDFENTFFSQHIVNFKAATWKNKVLFIIARHFSQRPFKNENIVSLSKLYDLEIEPQRVSAILGQLSTDKLINKKGRNWSLVGLTQAYFDSLLKSNLPVSNKLIKKPFEQKITINRTLTVGHGLSGVTTGKVEAIKPENLPQAVEFQPSAFLEQMSTQDKQDKQDEQKMPEMPEKKKFDHELIELIFDSLSDLSIRITEMRSSVDKINEQRLRSLPETTLTKGDIEMAIIKGISLCKLSAKFAKMSPENIQKVIQIASVIDDKIEQ